MLRSRLFPRSMLSVAWMLAVTLPALAWQSDQPFRDAVMAHSPVMYWPMDEAQGVSTVDDESGNNITGNHNSPNGPLTGSYPLTLDEGDASASYDGGDDHTLSVAFPNGLDDQLPPITLVAVMRSTNASQDACLFMYGRPDTDPADANANYRLEISGGNVAMSANGGAFGRLTSTVPVCDGVFHLIVAVFETQRDMNLYVDGKLVDTALFANLGLTSNTGRQASIATYVDDLGANNFNDEFEGNVAHCAVIDGALTDDDVAGLFRAFRPARFFDLVQEESGDNRRAGANRLNQSNLIRPSMPPARYDEFEWHENLDKSAPLHAHKYIFLDLERLNHVEQANYTYTVTGTPTPNGAHWDVPVSIPDPTSFPLPPEIQQVKVKNADNPSVPGGFPFEVVEVDSQGSSGTLTMEDAVPSPSLLRQNDTVFLFRYDYSDDYEFQRQAVEGWLNRMPYDPEDLFCIDGPPGASFDTLPPPSSWLTHWTPFFQPGYSIDLSDMISAPLYFRMDDGNQGWGLSLQDWKTRAQVWRDAIELEFPQHAAKPKFLWIAHRNGGSGDEKPWLHDLPLTGDPGPDWYIEMTRYCVQDLGVNVVGYGIETQGTNYQMAVQDYVVPALQAVSAAQPGRAHPKPIVDPPDLTTGLYSGALAVYWATDAKGREIRDLSGNKRTLRRVDSHPVDVHEAGYINPEIGMNGAALKIPRHVPSNPDSPPPSELIADGVHPLDHEVAFPNTVLQTVGGFTLSLILTVEQPVIAETEGVIGWSNAPGYEPSVTVFTQQTIDPYGPPRLNFQIRHLGADVILDTDVLNYGEPAHYVLTAGSSGSKLYRRRVGEPGGAEIASSSTQINFNVDGLTSYFTIGRLPPDGARSSCEIEQCVIWGRVLSGVELNSLAADPYQIP